ncbi:MAG: Imm1 family immunity protein [Pirellulaceae bacterium]
MTTSTTPTLQWSESAPPVEVWTGAHLDQLLDQLRPEFPISVVLYAHGCEVHLLLGLAESFVYFDEVSPTRYYITVGDSFVDGVVGFHLLGQHHTEFERRHLIPTATARRVLREFFETGQRPASVQWEEGTY